MTPSATIEDGPAAAAGKTTEKGTIMSPNRAISHGDELPGRSLPSI